MEISKYFNLAIKFFSVYEYTNVLMNHARLQAAAIAGDSDRIRALLKDACNVCVVDSYGCSALHYACWGGHCEVVRSLVANPWGVSIGGERGSSCLDLVTVKGYSALHLACLDCPPESVEDIVKTLLVAGIDADIRCVEGWTAFELAERNEDSSIAKEAFLSLDEDEIMYRSKVLEQQYTISSLKRWNVDRSELKGLKFRAPSFLFEELSRLPSIPSPLRIHEHHILPLVAESSNRKGVDALHCLEFGRAEAEANVARRAKLLQAFDPSWSSPSELELRLLQESGSGHSNGNSLRPGRYLDRQRRQEQPK